MIWPYHLITSSTKLVNSQLFLLAIEFFIIAILHIVSNSSNSLNFIHPVLVLAVTAASLSPLEFSLSLLASPGHKMLTLQLA